MAVQPPTPPHECACLTRGLRSAAKATRQILWGMQSMPARRPAKPPRPCNLSLARYPACRQCGRAHGGKRRPRTRPWRLRPPRPCRTQGVQHLSESRGWSRQEAPPQGPRRSPPNQTPACLAGPRAAPLARWRAPRTRRKASGRRAWAQRRRPCGPRGRGPPTCTWRRPHQSPWASPPGRCGTPAACKRRPSRSGLAESGCSGGCGACPRRSQPLPDPCGKFEPGSRIDN
mmetsp:Transcript_34699/g.104831  ORF Transcript_34699/g.104831 Transcript_34699/m.104831 type:complete len:230 (+) Transcript_34699:260-949(+)